MEETQVSHCLPKKEGQTMLSNQKKRSSERFEKGIINPKRAKSNGIRPKIHRFDPSRQVTINGCLVTLRQCRSFIMFEIETFIVLLSKSLPLKMNFQEFHQMVASYAKARRPQMTAEAKAWRHEFLSWKSFKHFLEHNLHDQCVRDILRTYVPHDAELKFDGSLGLNDAPVTFLGAESDYIKIAGITIPFMVKSGNIYFDLFPAFTLMGQLQVALKSDWREIDSMLVEQGFNLRTAFRINTTPENSYKTWRSQRGAITYDAFKALIKSKIVPLGERKERLLAILDHLDTDMMGLMQSREDLVNQLQGVVDDHVAPHLGPKSSYNVAGSLSGTEICYRGCGRYYHYTLKCCNDTHKIRYKGNYVNYIVQNGLIFFDKCTAFSVMDKISVVKNCDFRTVDKILESKSLPLDSHFLNENRDSVVARRTHVSFEAVQALVESGFGDCQEETREFIKRIAEKMAYYKGKCSKFSGIKIQTDLDESTDGEDSSSSGIESGCASDESSGKNTPVEIDIDETCNEFEETILDGKIILHLSLDNNHLYCDVKDLEPLVGIEYDELIKVLKRKYRSVDVDQSFRSRMFKAPTKSSFFSVRCFKLLLAKNYIKKVTNRAIALDALEKLLDKYNKIESDEEEDDEEEMMMEDDNEDVKPEIVETDVTVKIGELSVPYQVKDRNIFLDRKVLLSELLFVHYQQCRNYLKMDEILTENGFNVSKSFIWYNKNRKFISIPAMRLLIKEGYFSLRKPEMRAEVEACLDKLAKDKKDLLAKKVLYLPSFEAIPYKLSRGTVYLNTLAFLKAVGCSQKYLKDKPSKPYNTVYRLLKKLGMDGTGCFLKQGICKYGYISSKAAFTLFKSEHGPFRNKKRMKSLSNELQKSMKKFKKSIIVNNEHDSIDIVGDDIQIGDIKVRYQIKDGNIFFHRTTIFEAIGLEKALILNFKGLSSVNRILTSHKLEVAKSYLKSPDEQYGFISFTALWTILDAEDPIVTLLERRSTFCSDLLNMVQAALCHNLKSSQKHLLFDAIPWQIEKNGKFMLHKGKTIAYSELFDKAQVLASYSDYINIEHLMRFIRLESDQKRTSGYSNLIWTDMISAVLHETPKLRNHVKLIEFRQKLLQFVEVQLVNYLSKPDSVRSDNQPQKLLSQIKPDIEEVMAEFNQEIVPDEHVNIHENIPLDTIQEEDIAVENTAIENPESAITLEEFTKIEESVQTIRSGLIGDWHVMQCDSSEIRLIVNPGYGASKKISFIQPDVSAILKYDLCFKPLEAPQLSINDSRVPDELIQPIIKRELKRGLFGLLYNFLTLRPCFGNFQPELVETLEKRSRIKDDKADVKDLVIDTNFIGSSQNGRTYAGTVRSKECTVLATSKVSDMCTACSSLHCAVVINRSVLASPKKPSRSVSTESHQQSVWKLEESSLEGCTFLCPQLQSYNTSLPHQFLSSSQASSVVEHRVQIGENLNLKLTLNAKEIVGKTFPEFERTKQVGPLLDSVASMRMCVGYPDPLLVSEAKYLMSKREALPNEIKKFFNYITIDDDFQGTMNSTKLKGTMRTKSCRFVASDHADICDQCRLLQEPLNFLGL